MKKFLKKLSLFSYFPILSCALLETTNTATTFAIFTLNNKKLENKLNSEINEAIKNLNETAETANCNKLA